MTWAAADADNLDHATFFLSYGISRLPPSNLIQLGRYQDSNMC